MAKVRYVQGKKASYLALDSYDPLALYFCTDTNELFKGDQLYSDGVRIVLNYESLPAFSVAADGILYYCKSNGCGYVLNEERNGWLVAIHGVDNDTIAVNEQGLLSVEAISIEKVTGLSDELQRIEKIAVDGASVATADKAGVVKPGSEFAVSADGTLSLVSVEIAKVGGLEERLAAVEQTAVGEVRAIAKMVDYEVSSKPEGTIVNYLGKEIRVMCPANTDWKKQNSGDKADANAYYVGFKAYAPNDSVVNFKEDLAEKINDDTLYSFENNEFAGVDKFGRKYSIVWLPVASYNEDSDSWTYYGSMSAEGKYIGWYYSVEWYDAAGVKVSADTIRINLSNENCHTDIVPYYISDIKSKLTALENSTTWEEM